MKTKPLFLLLASVMCGASFSAFSADGTLNFTGRVVDESCQVDTTASTGGLTVALGDVPKSILAASGDKSPDTNFQIVLKGCPVSDDQISLSFTGTPDTTNTKLLQAVKGSGTTAATGVGIAIFDNTTGTPSAEPMDMSANPQSSTVTTDASGNATFKFVANIMNDGGTVVAGDANATATVTVNYE